MSKKIKLYTGTIEKQCSFPNCKNKAIVCVDPDNYNHDTGDFYDVDYHYCRHHAVEEGFCGSCGRWTAPWSSEDVSEFHCSEKKCFDHIQFK